MTRTPSTPESDPVAGSAFLVLALCLFVGYMGVRGMLEAWRGTAKRIRVPALFTLAVFFVAIINQLVRGHIEASPTRILPLVVGAMAGVAELCIRTPEAQDWFRLWQGGHVDGLEQL